MSEDQNSTIQQATDFVNAGKFEEALESSRAVLVTDPNSGDAKLIEAISLSQLGQSRDASEAFSAAIRMAPTNVKARFNAAVHEFNMGNTGQARTLANEALNLDSNHEGTKTLVEKMGPEQAPPQGGMQYPREAPEGFMPQNEGIAFIRNLGPTWVMLGWFLVICSFASFAYSAYNLVIHWADLMSAVSSKNQAQIQAVSNAMQTPLMQIFAWVVLGANMVWTIMDLIHRKGNFVWLIGHIPCTCLGLSFITQPLYILLGRK
ncbi:MAG: tetratricopeptide repeat protein [Armatimonadota bacterium]